MCKELEAKLFTNAMKGEWEEVVKMHDEHTEIYRAKFTKSEDTALHIAISDGQDSIVQKLLDSITRSGNRNEALKTGNERGNTPLHLAASLGNVRLCKYIANIDPELIDCRNHDSETPFFLAALHGKKDAFLCLYSFLQPNQIEGYPLCRRNDGDTILHCAIAGEYFDLAFQIINLYGNLVNWVNEQGISPLHILASKPSAFRSGSHMTRFDKFIYHCIFVDKLEAQTQRHQPLFQELENRESAKYPENYQTCANFARLIGKVLCLLVGSGKKDHGQQPDAEDPNREAQGHDLFPANYVTCFEAIKLMSKAMLIIFGLGSRRLVRIQEKKEKHVWSEQILDGLLQRTPTYLYENHGRDPQQSLSGNADGKMPSPFMDGNDAGFSLSQVPPREEDSEGKHSQHDNRGETNKKNSADDMPTIIPATEGCFTKNLEGCFNLHATITKNLEGCFTFHGTIGDQRGQKTETGKRETPVLVAAKNGVKEMVEKILQLFPVAIHDVSSDGKNIVLLAVENRQPHVYGLLLNKKTVKDSIFRKVDKDGNSALHLAARLGEYRPWLIPGAALQLQWEIKWYEYVKNSMPHHFFKRLNEKGKTPKEIFTETHSELVKSGGEWLKSTSESCSVVAALIATVAFATATTVPGGVKAEGTPVLETEPAFDCFAISSLVALCFSVTSVVMFLSILTSRYQDKDFGTSLPRKLLLGLTSLFISIAAMLISFCAGHFFVLKEKLRYAAFPVYAVTCLPVTFFAMAQFPLYFDLIWATFKKVPQRSYKVVPL